MGRPPQVIQEMRTSICKAICVAISMCSLLSGSPLAVSAEVNSQILTITLCKAGNVENPACVVLDTNQDLYLFPSLEEKGIKISSFVKDVQWHSRHDMLAAIVNRDLVPTFLFQSSAAMIVLGILAFCQRV